MDLLLSYSNHPEWVRSLQEVLRRIDEGDQTALNTLPPPPPPQPTPQTHGLSDEQVQTIFACYRGGIGPRELGKRHGITERAIKYLLKKHGVQRKRGDWKGVTEGGA